MTATTKFRNFALAALLTLLCSAQAARADCTSPTRAAGAIIYNVDHDVMQYCADSVWTAMTGGAPDLAGLADVDDALSPTDGQVLTYDDSAGHWVAANPAGGGSDVPSGAVMAFNLASCPAGWSPLATAAGRMIIGVGTLGSDTYNLNVTGGEARHTLTVGEMPSHSHSLADVAKKTSNGSYATGGVALPGQGTVATTDSAGGDSAHENRPPYLALLYCQKD